MLYLKQNKLFLVERSTRKVSNIWKVLHVTLFFAIAINFFINSIVLGRLYKSFQYNCILFCTNVTFDQESLPLDVFNKENLTKNIEEITDKIFVDLESKNALEQRTERDIDITSVATERRLLSFNSEESAESLEILNSNENKRVKRTSATQYSKISKDEWEGKIYTTKRGNANKYIKLNKEDTRLENDAYLKTIVRTNLNTEHKITKRSVDADQDNANKNTVSEENIKDHLKNNDSYNKENGTIKIHEITQENKTVIFKNETVYIYTNDVETILVYSKLNLAKSRFPSGYLCNLALSTVLATFIWGLFFGVMMTMCSKGGEGYMSDILSKPQNYLYWIVVTSVLFAILNFVVLSIFERGMAFFCEEFEIFTGTKQCSSAMDPFTIQFNKNNEQMNFYLWYLIVTYTLYVGPALIGAQILITLLRILCVADYQLYEVQLEDKSQTETMKETSRQNSLNVDTTTEEFASTMS